MLRPLVFALVFVRLMRYAYSVLNACRAWRFAAEDALGSKLEGAAWARPRWAYPELIDAAVALRHGNSADLQASQVDEFLKYVEHHFEPVSRERTLGLFAVPDCSGDRAGPVRAFTAGVSHRVRADWLGSPP